MARIAKSRFAKAARNFGITFASILVVVVGIGVAYTWYMGKNGPVTQTSVVETPAPKTNITPTKPAANTPVGASIQYLTSPVNPAMNASVTAKSVPTATCTITIVYDKSASKDSGLIQKQADDFGMVDWTWTVDPTAPVGKWPVTITCTYNKKSAVVVGDLQIVRTPIE